MQLDPKFEISYEGIDEAELIHALYRGTRPVGLGMHTNRPGLTLQEVKADLEEMRASKFFQDKYDFDYYYGRPFKLTFDLKTKVLHRIDLYNRDAGPGTAERIIENLRNRKS
jgi:hypothetical protein